MGVTLLAAEIEYNPPLRAESFDPRPCVRGDEVKNRVTCVALYRLKVEFQFDLERANADSQGIATTAHCRGLLERDRGILV